MPCKHLLKNSCKCQEPQAVQAPAPEPVKRSHGQPRAPWAVRHEQEQAEIRATRERLTLEYLMGQVQAAVIAGKADALLKRLTGVVAEQSFSQFCQGAWHVVEPSTRLEWGDHHELLCTTLQALFEDWYLTKADPEHSPTVLNTAINCPPGSLKPVDEDGIVQERDRGLVPLKEIVVGDHVLTHRGRYRRVLAVAEQGDLPVVQLTTGRGRVVRAAPDHPLLTQRGWVDAAGVTTRDVLAAVHGEQDPRDADHDALREARLLGYLIGDGCTKERSASFTNQDTECVDDFVACAAALGFDHTKRSRAAKYTKGKPGRGTHVIELKTRKPTLCVGCRVAPVSGGAWCTPCRNKRSNDRDPTPYDRPDQAIWRWLQHHKLDGAKSRTKRVPAFVMSGSDDLVADYLAAYWACDGGIQDRRDIPRAGRDNQKTNSVRVDAYTVSPGLARDHQALLQRLGMEFSLRHKTTRLTKAMCGASGERIGQEYDCWQISASDQDTAAKFMQIIGPRLRHEKRTRAQGLQRTKFDQTLNPDAVVAISDGGAATCRCLQVEEDSSFVYQGVAVHNSRLVAVFYQAWCWLRCPGMKFICLSVNETAAMRDARACRDLVKSDWYQATFMPWWSLKGDQDAVSDYGNTAGGGRLSQASGSEIIGLRGDCVDGDTTVATERGPITIRDLHQMPHKGQEWPRVWSLDRQTGRRELQEIVATRLIPERPLVEIRTETGRILRCTPDHLIYAPTHYAGVWQGAYVEAQNMIGRVVDVTQRLEHVRSVECLEDTRDVYDIQIAKNSNFYAGGILVHNCLLIDDANNPNDADNLVERKHVNEQWDNNIYNRVNNPTVSMRIGIQQRTHAKDWTGHVVAKQGLWSPSNRNGWLHVILPAEFETSREPFELPAPLAKLVSALPGAIMRDWRKVQGQVLHPKRMTQEYLAGEKRRWAGTGKYAGQMQQRPSAEGGGKVKKTLLGWFRLGRGVRDEVDELETSLPRPDGCHSGEAKIIGSVPLQPGRWDFDKVVLSIDAALKKTEEGSLWGMMMIGYRGARRYIMDDRSERMEPDEAENVAIEMIKYWQPDMALIENKAGGPGLARGLQIRMGDGDVPMTAVTLWDPGVADKTARVNLAVPTFSNGHVFILDGAPWAEAVVAELTGWPAHDTDDRMDCVVQTILHERDAAAPPPAAEQWAQAGF